MKPKLLISACLIGVECNYKSACCSLPGNSPGVFQEIIDKYDVIPVCPEQLGGLPTPRIASEIQNGTGDDVIDSRAGVFSSQGADVTENFIKGAHSALRVAQVTGAKKALLQTNSPSCGGLNIHNGFFKGELRQGMGVTAALLNRRGIKVIDASQVSEII